MDAEKSKHQDLCALRASAVFFPVSSVPSCSYPDPGRFYLLPCRRGLKLAGMASDTQLSPMMAQ
ncbi:MAG: hypothetical protein ACREIC_30435, partial [Limisphaerales bacterium]